MTCEDKLYALLTANAALVAAVPAARIKPPGDWQALARPYIVHQPIAGETTWCEDGPKALRIWRYYQVIVYAASHSEARRIADLVVTALDGHYDADVDKIALTHPPMSLGYDTDRKVSMIALDFEVAGALT